MVRIFVARQCIFVKVGVECDLLLVRDLGHGNLITVKEKASLMVSYVMRAMWRVVCGVVCGVRCAVWCEFVRF